MILLRLLLLFFSTQTFLVEGGANELVFVATCDNVLDVFVDGTPQQGSNDNNWRKSSSFSLPAGSGILAVSCLDIHQDYRGLLGYINNGDPTNSRRKCTNKLESGWQNPDFDDSNWIHPRENGANGVGPWGQIEGINDVAQWIWTGSKKSQYPDGPNQMWCRYKFEVVCAPGWTEFNKKCYYFSQEKKANTWNEAHDTCTSLNPAASLVSITSQKELEFIITNREGNGKYIFIGATDKGSEGNWRWLDGSAWCFQNWVPTEPNNAGGNENCAYMHTNGQWNDIPCGTKNPYSYICSY